MTSLRQRTSISSLRSPRNSDTFSPSLSSARRTSGTGFLDIHHPSSSTGRDYYDDDDNKKKSHTSGHRVGTKLMLFLLLAAAPWLYRVVMRNLHTRLLAQLKFKQTEQQRLERQVRWTTAKLTAAKQAAAEQEKVNTGLYQTLMHRGDFVDMNSEAFKKAEEAEEAYLKRLDDLEHSLIHTQTRHLQKYRNNPIQVRVTLKTKKAGHKAKYVISRLKSSSDHTNDDRNNEEEEEDQQLPSFVIQMAPLHIAPHAVGHFIRLVESQVFDGLSLLHQNHHDDHGSSRIIHSAPIQADTQMFADERFKQPLVMKSSYNRRYDANKYNNTMTSMELAFTEPPTEEYPNEKYTVAFSDRGPNFFINMGATWASNRKEDDLIQSDESCFGKVVEGQHVLEAIIRQHKSKALMMIGIHSMRVIL